MALLSQLEYNELMDIVDNTSGIAEKDASCLPYLANMEYTSINISINYLLATYAFHTNYAIDTIYTINTI